MVMDTTNITVQPMNHSGRDVVDPNTLEDVPIPSEISASGVAVGVLLIATGVFGNALVILSVVCNKHLCKASNAFIISLALCDIFQNIMVKPLYIHTYLVGDWIFSRSVCLYVLFASNLTILESIIHITAIAFFRYLVIVCPRIGHKIASWKAVSVILILVYLLPIAATIFFALPKAMNGHVQFNKRIMFCSFVKHNDFRLRGVLQKIGFLLVAASVILFSYAKIYYKSKKTLKSVYNSNDQPHPPLVHSNSRVKNDMALQRTVGTIFIAFAICYLPLSILYAMDTARTFHYWLYFIGVMLLWSSSSINWIIYFCVNRRFRKAYKNILCGLRVSRLMSVDVKISRNGGHQHRPVSRVSGHRNQKNGSIVSSRSAASFSHFDSDRIYYRGSLCRTGSGLPKQMATKSI